METGVSAVESNAEQGLLTISCDVKPTTLLHKLTKWGKMADIVSVVGDSYARVPRTPEQKPYQDNGEEEEANKVLSSNVF